MFYSIVYLTEKVIPKIPKLEKLRKTGCSAGTAWDCLAARIKEV